ncbi:MAG: hypothetical protein AB7L66_05190 [Gemmatimonadales bacterium]
MARIAPFLVLGVGLLAAGCKGEDTCICTPIDDVTRTVEVTTDRGCESVASQEPRIYSSCIESSASVSPFGPTIALNVWSDPTWSSPWPYQGAALPKLEPVWLAVR